MLSKKGINKLHKVELKTIHDVPIAEISKYNVSLFIVLFGISK